ncbi:type I-B CRISPR-associated endonuclease Cas1b [Kosmotoga sp. DU53]|uniref:type I-B CRISPR-associated endonuclease Cas1b n=1 Tax=Kosmotoga sp. DU53 TaxID=1310160 RepID=UPI0007C4C713|nr:type I-B CRISPR-associated endonuclease Cas1b [Kosmotoga sp. DU53]OAA23726.1 CRISPR-associated protein Cas1 [Kosmotoga sp. DU53]
MKKNYFLFSSGTLMRKDNTLAIEKLDGKKKHIPVEKIESLYLFGELTFNTRLLSFISQKQIILHVFNRNGWYVGSFGPRKQKVSGKLLVEQVKAYLNPEKRTKLAREFIDSAMHNILRIIQRSNKNHKIEELNKVRERLKTSASISEIMSCEGEFRQKYYPILAKITAQEFHGRQKQPPVGRLNSLISFGNTLLYTRVLNKIYQTQLNPTISYLHEPSEMRFSLSLDIAEVFKPVIVDRLIITMFNKKMLQDSDFDEDLNSTLLNEEGRKKFINAFEDFMENTIFYPRLKRKVSYDTLIKLECYKLIRSLLSDEEYIGMKMWW